MTRVAIQPLVLALGIFLVGCAPVQMRSQVDRPAGESYASTGDIVLRVNRMDDLPKVFGRADLFGRTRDRGFSEVRYMGLNASGMPVFQRRDVDIMTNETTMSRTGGFSNSVLWNFQDAADAPDIVLEHYPGDDGGLVFPATVEILGGVIQLNDLVRNGKVEKIGRGRTMRWKLADRN